MPALILKGNHAKILKGNHAKIDKGNHAKIDKGNHAKIDKGNHGGLPLRRKSMSLPDVVHRFKSLTTARYRHGVRDHGWPAFRGRLWQRNYYEHVIRDDDDLNNIREYIVNNPLRWDEDTENPDFIVPVGALLATPWLKNDMVHIHHRRGATRWVARNGMPKKQGDRPNRPLNDPNIRWAQPILHLRAES